MIYDIGDDALVERMIVLDYEFAGGPKTGTLAKWRKRIRQSADGEVDFMERAIAMNSEGCLAGVLTDDQALDVTRFATSIHLMLDVIEMQDSILTTRD